MNNHLPQTTSTNINVRFFYSLRGQLLLFFLGLALLPLIGVAIITDRQSEQALRDQKINEIAKLANIQTKRIDTWIQARLSEIKVMAGAARIRSMEPAKVNEALQLYATEWSQYESLFVTGLDGKTIVQTDGESLNLADQEYLQKALRGEVNISEALVSRATGNVILVVAAPVLREDELVGVVGATIPTTELTDLMHDAEIGQTGVGYVLNSAGLMITSSRFKDELKHLGLIKERTELELKVDTPGAQAVLAGKTGVAEYLDYRNQPVLGAYTPLGQMGWGIIVEISQDEAFAAITQMRATIIIIALITIVLVASLAFFVAHWLVQPILAMTEAARRLARGEVNQTISIQSRGELGLMAAAFRQMITYLQEMVGAADHLAQGDLTVKVTSQSEQDALGQAFVRMTAQLHQLIGQVSASAQQVGYASEQLSTVAEQAGQATAQIAATMQQVAQGTAQQSQGVAHIATAMAGMNRTVDGVTRGGQAQAVAVGRAVGISSQMAELIHHVADSAQKGTHGAIGAAQTAQLGAETVEATLKQMETIKTRVGLSSQKVVEMGQRSNQIGVIVETIDDIASQTNLLALNAAIEAARAGEHGKGFAVVADEVRKLAEKSTLATQEISRLITSIQQTVAEAVTAMAEGSNEIEAGVDRADAAGQALHNILKAVADVSQQVAEISTAAEQMNASAQEANTAMDTVKAVVEQNMAATEQMTASSTQVGRLVEGIAAVSQETSASVEEVSASAEEMNAQVEEVTASAHALRDMATALQQLVTQFKLTVGVTSLMTSSEGIEKQLHHVCRGRSELAKISP
ncbi:MAG: methyl-accepting chemotaxis protein [Anaerolineae bacterium]